MKTIIYKLLWSFSIVLLITSCSKEVQVANEQFTQEQSTLDMKSISISQGVLKFNSRADFKNTLKALNGKSVNFVLDWNKSLGFRSQEAIFQEIIEAENIVRDKQAAGLDPDITLKEFLDAGLTWDHSPIYIEYINKGLIIEMTDHDGCKWFKHNVLNPTYMPLLNEEGFVVLGDTLYQFTKDKVKYSPGGSLSKIPKLADANETDQDQNIYVVTVKDRQKATVDWGKSTGWKYDPSNNKKRVMAEVVGLSPYISYPVLGITVTYYKEITAHKKVLFWWNIRNDYKPIEWTQGSWYWTEYYTSSPDFNGSGTLSYPFPGNTNYCKIYLDPDGWVGNGSVELEEFEINSYYFNSSADGIISSLVLVGP